MKTITQFTTHATRIIKCLTLSFPMPPLSVSFFNTRLENLGA